MDPPSSVLCCYCGLVAYRFKNVTSDHYKHLKDQTNKQCYKEYSTQLLQLIFQKAICKSVQLSRAFLGL